jgi:class 3 adenylate cyclase
MLSLLNRLSIQSKLVLMLLMVSLLAFGVIGYEGYRSGRAALQKAVYNQLTSVRETKTHEVQEQLGVLRDLTLTLAEAQSYVGAMRDFRAAFRELDEATITPEMDAGLDEFYRRKFLPLLQGRLGGTSKAVAENYIPRTIAARYLQYHYIARNPAPYEQMQKLEAAGDGSRYSEIHRRFHPVAASIARRFQIEDMQLVDAETLDVVYSYQKTVDFGTNLDSGPFARTNLGDLAADVRRSMNMGDYQMTDFAMWRPNLDRPNAFIGTPIFDGTKLIGMLMLQFPIEEINRIMTGNFQWEKEGLGRTGEVYLVGDDTLMRSRSRFMIQDKPGLMADLRRAGHPASLVDRIDRLSSLILLLPVKGPHIAAAISGERGIMVTTDYRGTSVLSSYAPIDVEGHRWAIVAEMDSAEAFGPIAGYARRLLAYGAGIVLATALLATVLASLLVRPLHRLAEGARRIGAGETDVKVEVRSRDEFAELARAFNEMSLSLKVKNHLLEEKARENEELLLNILPTTAAARRKDGETAISDSFADVTVLYADIVGFEELSAGMPADKAVSLLNDLIVAFDEAAERSGVEKVKTIGSSYLAVCGLSVHRPDHTNRVVEFARDLQRLVRRFNQERATALTVRIGINAGPVVGGVVGRSKFIYDLWGDTVNVARRIKSEGNDHAIQVTRAVYDRVCDLHRFDPLGEFELPGGRVETVWTLRADGAAEPAPAAGAAS